MQDYVDHWLSYVSLDRPIENSYYVQVDHLKLSIYQKYIAIIYDSPKRFYPASI